MTDKQFYEEIIGQCLAVFPFVNEWDGLCRIGDLLGLGALPMICDKISGTKYSTKGYGYYSAKPRRLINNYRYTSEWKADRIDLLKEIMRYCKYKISQNA